MPAFFTAYAKIKQITRVKTFLIFLKTKGIKSKNLQPELNFRLKLWRFYWLGTVFNAVPPRLERGTLSLEG